MLSKFILQKAFMQITKICILFDCSNGEKEIKNLEEEGLKKLKCPELVKIQIQISKASVERPIKKNKLDVRAKYFLAKIGSGNYHP